MELSTILFLQIRFTHGLLFSSIWEQRCDSLLEATDVKKTAACQKDLPQKDKKKGTKAMNKILLGCAAEFSHFQLINHAPFKEFRFSSVHHELDLPLHIGFRI